MFYLYNIYVPDSQDIEIPYSYPIEKRKTRRDSEELMLTRIQKSPLYKPPDERSKYGYFADRHIIGPYSKIKGGVFLGTKQREALVVDDSDPDSPMSALYSEIAETLDSPSPAEDEYFLQEVSDRLRGAMKGDTTNKLAEEVLKRGWANDHKVDIDCFFALNVANCRIYAPAAAYMIERAIDEGKITKGKVTIERCLIKDEGRHDWVRVEFENQEDPYIVDPANEFVGKLTDLPQEGRWLYSKPDEPSFRGF